MSTNASPEDPFDFVASRLGALPFDLNWAGGEFRTWRDRLRSVWEETLPPRGIVDTRLEGDFIWLRHATGAVVEGRFTCPSGPGPHPAVLLLHEHGGAFDTGWEKLHVHQSSRRSQNALYGGQVVAARFAAAGFATLACDAPCFGRRSAGGYAGQQALAADLGVCGWSLAGVSASENAALADWLSARAEIGHVGVFGFSMGGHNAWQAAALSTSIAATASIGWMARRADLMGPGLPLRAGHSAWHFTHPGVSHRADIPDLAGLAADRPMFLRSGRGDRHMPESSVEAAWSKIARIAASAGGSPPETGFHHHAHTCPPEVLDEAIAFFGKHLCE